MAQKYLIGAKNMNHIYLVRRIKKFQAQKIMSVHSALEKNASAPNKFLRARAT